MSKQNGLGDRFFIGSVDLSGDTQSLGGISGGCATIDVTGIDKSAFERIGGVRDGKISWVSFFNPALGKAHKTLSPLPSTDVICTYLRGTTLGNPSASMVGKQLNYDPTRGNDGALTFAVEAQSNGYGINWGQQLTAGLRTDTAATLGSSIDTLASASFGWQSFLHVTAFTGTDVTVKIQDSADNSSWADLSGAGFTTVTSVGSERKASSSPTATVRRYVRVITTTSAGFTSVSFVVNFIKNETLVSF